MITTTLTAAEIKDARKTIKKAAELRQNPRWREESGIHFAYQSAGRRNNSYTASQIILLIKDGYITRSKPLSDAKIIMDLCKAYHDILCAYSAERVARGKSP